MTFFYTENKALEYLRDIRAISKHQFKSLIGMMNEDFTGVINFLHKQPQLTPVWGHYGCGIDCCGNKWNYYVRFVSNEELEEVEEQNSLYGENF